MPNSAETIEKLSKLLERHKLLALAGECRDLEEFIEKLKTIIESDA